MCLLQIIRAKKRVSSHVKTWPFYLYGGVRLPWGGKSVNFISLIFPSFLPSLPVAEA